MNLIPPLLYTEISNTKIGLQKLLNKNFRQENNISNFEGQNTIPIYQMTPNDYVTQLLCSFIRSQKNRTPKHYNFHQRRPHLEKV